MKKIVSKSKVISVILLLLLIIPAVLMSSCGKKEVDNKSKKPKTELVFSFESYEDITGTSIRVGNQLGATKINKDKEYITHGKGSWLVKPQGDYGQKDTYPYFQMRCKDTTFKTNNFDAYEKIMLDVYNASNEEVQIKLNFKVKNMYDDYSNTEEVIYTLKPNAWTTCEYDLTGEAYSVSMLLEEVQYMTVTFMTKKEAKDDKVPELYFDNLRGKFADKTRERMELEYSFEDGITFEDSKDQYIFQGASGTRIKMNLSRKAYADTTIEALDDTHGEYVLVSDPTGPVWPGMTAYFDKTYPAGSILTFMMYAEVDESVAAGKMYTVESRVESGGTQNKMITSSSRFNRWVQVTIELTEDSDKAYIFANFDDRSGAENSILGDEPVKLYMDNFYMQGAYVGDFDKGITFEEDKEQYLFSDGYRGVNYFSLSRVAYSSTDIKAKDSSFGEYTLSGDATGARFPMFKVNFGKTYKKGMTLSFWVYIDGKVEIKDGTCKFEFKGDKEEGNTHYIQTNVTPNQWVKVSYTFTDDHDGGVLFANFDSKDKKSIFGSNEVKIYMDNFYIRDYGNFDKTIDFEKADHLELFKSGYSGANALSLSRVAYANTTIASKTDKETYGNYGMLGETQGTTYPMFDASFGKTYQKGQTLRFMVYIEGEPVDTSTEDIRCKIEFKGRNGNKQNATYIKAGVQLNKWVQVEFTLKDTHDNGQIFANFKDAKTGQSIFGNNKVKIYFDNFIIDGTPSSGEEDHKVDGNFDNEITFEDSKDQQYFRDGYTGVNALTLSRVAYADTTIASKTDKAKYGDYGLMGEAKGSTYPMWKVNLGKTYQAGDKLIFMLYIEGKLADTATADQRCKVEFKGSNGKTQNATYSLAGKRLNQWIPVEFTFKEAHDNGVLFVNLNQNGDSIFGNNKVKIYMDNFIVEPKETLKEVDGNLDTPLTLEDAKDMEMFSAVSRGAEEYCTLSRVAYADTTITADLDVYGSYGLLAQKAATADQNYMKIKVNFGKTYEAGTKLKFHVYIQGDKAISKADPRCKIEYFGYNGTTEAGKLAVAGKRINQWVTDIEFTLTEANNNCVIMLNLKDGNESIFGSNNVNVYMDNFVIVSDAAEEEPEPIEGNFDEAITFEDAKDQQFFTSKYTGDNAITLSRVAYEDTTITADETIYGEYALKGTAESSQYPKFNINFGKTYVAGSTLKFKVYVEAPGVTNKNYKLEFKGYSGTDVTGTESVDTDGKNYRFKGYNKWQDVEITFADDVSSMWLFANLAQDNNLTLDGTEVTAIYFDNFVIESYQSDFTKGLTFESAKDAAQFVEETADHCALARVAYADTSITADAATYGFYALKATATGPKYMQFKVNFDKSYAAGSKFKFSVYFDGAKSTTDADPRCKITYKGYNANGQVQSKTFPGKKLNQWVTDFEFELTGDTTYCVVMLEMKDSKNASIFGTNEVNVYMDNFVMVSNAAEEEPEPIEGNFDEAITFEDAKDQQFFTSKYTGDNAITLSRVAYADTTITADEAIYGEYALKGTAESSQYPKFNINFGKTYKAGSTLKFKVYVEAPGVTNKNYKLEFKGYSDADVTGTESVDTDGKNYRFKGYNQWQDVEITFAKDVASMWMFVNLEQNHNLTLNGTEVTAIYFDNFVMENYESNFVNGVGLENEKDAVQFVEETADHCALARVAYADTSITPDAATYGSYALKATATGPKYMQFKINFDKTYAAGSKFKFSVYFDGTKATTDADPRCKITYKGYNANGQVQSKTFAGKKLNQWVTDFEFELTEDTTYCVVMLEMKDSKNASIFGTNEVNVYMDNFVVQTVQSSMLSSVVLAVKNILASLPQL